VRITTRSNRRWWCICGLALLLSLATNANLHALESTRESDPGLTSWSVPDDVPDLASPKILDRVLAKLRANDAEDDAGGVGLIGDLETYRQHRLDDIQARSIATVEALDKMVEHRQAGKIIQALTTALEASSQSLDPQALLEDVRVKTLIEQTEAAAVAATAQGRWLEVMGLYRLLNMLFDPASPYRKPYELAEMRIRILARYAPDQVEQMRKRLQEHALDEEADYRAEPDPESWQVVLEGVELRMLTQAIRNSSRHVSSPHMRQLLHGAVDRLLLLIDIDGLGSTFDALNDPAKVQDFRRFLHDKRREIDEARFGLLHNPTNRLLNDILVYSQEHDLLPRRVLIFELAQGAIGTLDRFSEVVWPYHTKNLERSTKGVFMGVGIQIRLSEDREIKVITPIRNTPAFHNGVSAGDIIATVDGHATAGWSLNRAVHAITGPQGSKVTLGMKRQDVEELVLIELHRARVPIESVLGWKLKPDNDWDFYIDKPNRIGYIRLSQFVPQSADDLDHAVAQMQHDAGLDALILDLRFNPGGLLSQAVQVANRFVPRGRIVSIVNADRVEKGKKDARPDRAYDPMEVVVLINRTSASASEIVAGAVQDHQRAIIVGGRSYGKGSVQDVFPIDNYRAYLKLTTQYYMLPLNRIIHRKPGDSTWGIDPDLKIDGPEKKVAEALNLRQKADVLYPPKATTEDQSKDPQKILDQGVDPQLETALLIIKLKLRDNRIRIAQRHAPAHR
jgi:carboxyl-terminal processing protease